MINSFLSFGLAKIYTEEGNVLVLTDDDFPAVTKEFSHSFSTFCIFRNIHLI